MFEGLINLGPNPSDESIRQNVIEIFKTKWITGYDYMSIEPTRYKSKSIPENKKKQLFYAMSVLYVQHIASCSDNWQFDKLQEIERAEVSRWDKNGGFCIYTSVLLWCLLYEGGIFNSDEIKLVQGYYKHPAGGFISEMLGQNPLDQIGLHAWVEIEGAVLDLAIVQQQSIFDFKGEPFIIEDIPETMELTGWTENKGTVKQYARQIAKESNMTYRDWINYHMKQAEKTTLDAIKDELE